MTRIEVAATLERVLEWYFRGSFGRSEGPGVLPFYCDPTRVGAFALAPAELATGGDAAIFHLLVTLSMYQALRDVVVMRRQRALSPSSARVLVDLGFVGRSVAQHDCPAFLSVDAFETDCNVSKSNGLVDCGKRPGGRCHVKDATVAFHRMGDMGKLPTSAWLGLWRYGGMPKVLSDVCREDPSPTQRAVLLVERFAHVHRFGRKLATMFVSALSTPALAPGLTPWSPDVDGNELVVVDTNVARAVDALAEFGAPRTYGAREHWVRQHAKRLNLRAFRPELPAYSPRLRNRCTTTRSGGAAVQSASSRA